MASLFQEITEARPETIQSLSMDSLDWFRQNVRDIRRTPENIQKQNQNFVTRIELGRMHMFFYRPKTEAKLPYWDNFPVTICIKRYATGFLGLNLHYIAPRYRILLLDAMYEFLMENDDKPEDTRFRVIYQMVKSMSKLRWARPCLKQYQYNYIDSRICQVMPEHFDLVAMLTTQRFQKANANYVYSRSREKF